MNAIKFMYRENSVFLILIDSTWIRYCFGVFQYGHALSCIETCWHCIVIQLLYQRLYG